MDREFILRKLSNLMGWGEARDDLEFPWLRLMSRLKYDGYQDFPPGARFIESLVDWLQQFKPEDRETAYNFLRRRLVYIGPSEMQHLVELFYPEEVQPRLVSAVAADCSIPPYRVWVEPGAEGAYLRLVRKTLFVELSDGARIDIFRRANPGIINHEQIVTAPRISPEKWADLLKDLRESLGDGDARFSTVYLVDDFTASGTNLIRYDEEKGRWKGKLPRFWEEMCQYAKTHFEDTWRVYVHHFVGTAHACEEIQRRERKLGEERKPDEWFPSVEFTFGTVLPTTLPVNRENPHEFLRLVEACYDPAIEAEKHNIVGGSKDIRHGYAQCALPVVLDHNTPNNSLALLWAESAGQGGRHEMRPLFRRRQRHV
ncbi:MAG: hypothetical protein L0Z62_49660 [Gemmataceae bacterium]|nr:hypothetical protein [Gemmataceae bacterium]